MATTWKPEPQLLEPLDAAVPDILASQKENGQFGTEPWISTDQNVMLALAAAWSLEESSHYHCRPGDLLPPTMRPICFFMEERGRLRRRPRAGSGICTAWGTRR
jgi:hypothetical protein